MVRRRLDELGLALLARYVPLPARPLPPGMDVWTWVELQVYRRLLGIIAVECICAVVLLGGWWAIVETLRHAPLR